jgi:hypothetical protein
VNVSNSADCVLNSIQDEPLYLMPEPLYVYVVPNVSNATFDGRWIQETTVCQSSNHYEWGFSAHLLLVFSIVTALFAAILAGLQVTSFADGRTSRLEQHVSVYRDVLDLATALKAQLGEEVEEASAVAIDGMLKRPQNKGAVTIDTKDLPLPRRDSWQRPRWLRWRRKP